jgi:hypothetical protein
MKAGSITGGHLKRTGSNDVQSLPEVAIDCAISFARMEWTAAFLLPAKTI